MQNTDYQTSETSDSWYLIEDACHNMQAPADSAMFSVYEYSKRELKAQLSEFESESVRLNSKVLSAVAGLKALKERTEIKSMSSMDLIKYMRTQGKPHDF